MRPIGFVAFASILFVLAMGTVLFMNGNIVSFTTVDVPTGTDPEATVGDTLVFLEGPGMTIVGSANDTVTFTASITGAATQVALDIGNNAVDDSAAITRINITAADTNSIFTETPADELLIDPALNWPTADLADTATALAANPTDCAASTFANAIDASANLTCATPLITVQEEDVTVGDGDTLDFQAGFDVTESPANELNISIDLAEVPVTDDGALVGTGAGLGVSILPDCTGTNDAVTYVTGSNTFGCNSMFSQHGIVFVQEGTITVTAAATTIEFPVFSINTIQDVTCRVSIAPTGASIIVDVNANGTTIFTTQSNRPEIAVSTQQDTSGTPDVTSLVLSDSVDIDIDQIGSTIAGSDLVCVVRVRQTIFNTS